MPTSSSILLDLSLPDRDGFALLAELRERYPGDLGRRPVGAQRSRQCGAGARSRRARLHSEIAPREVMLSALQLVFSGGIYIPPEILGAAQARAAAAPSRSARRKADGSPADLGLTERQVDVLALMMQGKSNKAICRALDLAEPTVKNHVTAILKALKVTNRTEAVIAAATLGWELPRTSR